MTSVFDRRRSMALISRGWASRSVSRSWQTIGHLENARTGTSAVGSGPRAGRAFIGEAREGAQTSIVVSAVSGPTPGCVSRSWTWGSAPATAAICASSWSIRVVNQASDARLSSRQRAVWGKGQGLRLGGGPAGSTTPHEARCIGPCGVPRPSLADYVIGTGATRGATAAGTC
jgi:hypothetical protein